VNDPSDPAVIEMVNEAMRAYEYALASEPNLTSPSEVQQVTGVSVLAMLRAGTVYRTGF
jgi:hypothetical protein